jgi:hypothetical protein
MINEPQIWFDLEKNRNVVEKKKMSGECRVYAVVILGANPIMWEKLKGEIT